jgi:cobalamin biosynthesis Co2+ chelatase CbiK
MTQERPRDGTVKATYAGFKKKPIPIVKDNKVTIIKRIDVEQWNDINEAIVILNKLLEQGWQEICIEADSYNDGENFIYSYVSGKYNATEKEIKDFNNLLCTRESMQENRDYKQYLALKKRFEEETSA